MSARGGLIGSAADITVAFGPADATALDPLSAPGVEGAAVGFDDGDFILI